MLSSILVNTHAIYEVDISIFDDPSECRVCLVHCELWGKTLCPPELPHSNGWVIMNIYLHSCRYWSGPFAGFRFDVAPCLLRVGRFHLKPQGQVVSMSSLRDSLSSQGHPRKQSQLTTNKLLMAMAKQTMGMTFILKDKVGSTSPASGSTSSFTKVKIWVIKSLVRRMCITASRKVSCIVCRL